MRAVRVAVIVGPAELDEDRFRFLVAHARDLTEGQCPCCAGEKEMLGQVGISVDLSTDMYDLLSLLSTDKSTYMLI